MNPECELIQSLMHEYFDGELEYDLSLKVKKHLENCNECREFYEKIERLSTMIKRAFSYSSENNTTASF